MKAKQLAMAMTLAGLMMAGCESNPSRPGDPNNPSPTAGSDSSNKANDMADKLAHERVQFVFTFICHDEVWNHTTLRSPTLKPRRPPTSSTSTRPTTPQKPGCPTTASWIASCRG